MSHWLNFVSSGWAGPVFLAVTVVGLVLSVVAWRRKGARSGIRGAAWSLLPLAAYLTHSLGLVGRIISAIVQFGTAFVLSPTTWLGVILVGVAAALFLVSGGIPLTGSRRRRKKDGRGGKKDGGKKDSQPAALVPSGRNQPGVPADDDLSDVHDILKRHGIS